MTPNYHFNIVLQVINFAIFATSFIVLRRFIVRLFSGATKLILTKAQNVDFVTRTSGLSKSPLISVIKVHLIAAVRLIEQISNTLYNIPA